MTVRHPPQVIPLLRQPHTAEQIFESRIGAEGRKPRISVEKNHGDTAVKATSLASLFQPIESPFFVAGGDVGHGHVDRHNNLVRRLKML